MGRELTDEERKAIASLERLAKRWPKTLMLFAWSGTLHVMRVEEVEQAFVNDRGYTDASVTTIPIHCDGGDPNA